MQRQQPSKPPDGWATTRRLVAALVSEGLAPARLDGADLVVDLGGRALRICWSPGPGGTPSAPRPWELERPARLEGSESVDAVEVLRAAALAGTRTGVEKLRRRLNSSIAHAAVAEAARPDEPALGARLRQWDAAVVARDTLDPLHSARTGWRPADSDSWTLAGGEPVALQFAAIAASEARVVGPWADLTAVWIPPGRPGELVLPVHPSHAEAAGASLGRTRAALPGLSPGTLAPRRATHLVQVPLRVDALLPAELLVAAVPLSALVARCAPEGLRVARDLAAVGTDDSLVGCVLREDPERVWHEVALAGCAALCEEGADGSTRALRLPGAGAGVAFVDSYAGRLLSALVPLLEQGIAVDARPLNLLACYRGRRLAGFALRSALGTRLLRDSAVVADALDGAPVWEDDPEEAWSRVHYEVVHLHLAPLVHAVGAGAEGWGRVLDHLDRLASGTALHRSWTAMTTLRPALLRSHLGQAEARPRELPNPLALL